MNLEEIREYCQTLPHVTEDVKWGNDLCFLLAGKMFCVACLVPPFSVSLKVTDEEFNTLIETKEIIPAPYMARNKWIQVHDENRFSNAEWKHYIRQSYEIKKAKLTKKVLKELKLA